MPPGGETETRMAPDGKHVLFSPSLKTMLPTLNEGITGLPADPDTSLLWHARPDYSFMIWQKARDIPWLAAVHFVTPLGWRNRGRQGKCARRPP
jgi:hypothetical protein